MKRPFERLWLTMVEWQGDLPRPGEWLRTRTGRTYEIISIVGKRLECIVLPKNFQAIDEPRIHNWHWLPRTRKANSWA